MDTGEGMFRGIASDFLTYFPDLQKLRLLTVARTGLVIPVRIGNRFVYNLVTKPCYWDKPKIYDLHLSLESMLAHAVENMVSNIAITLLGSGCDKLDFVHQVMPLIEQIFGKSAVNVHIYYLGKDSNMIMERYIFFMSLPCYIDVLRFSWCGKAFTIFSKGIF